MAPLKANTEELPFWKQPRGALLTLGLGLLLVMAAGLFTLSNVPSFGLYGFLRDFPPIHDPSSVRISLQRTLCFGTCPAYSVVISGNGDVTYRGQECVAEKGTRTGRVDQAHLAKLIGDFRAAHYFSLKDGYRYPVTDVPTFMTSIAFDGRKKRVFDYSGLDAGMPRSVQDLEDEIDKVAGTDKWVYGSGRTCFRQPVDDSWRKAKP